MPRAARLRAWIKARRAEQIWLSGAGSSAYIGQCLASPAPRRNHRLVAVPTTDLVANPQDYQNAGSDGRILCVHFGRSGESSETIETMNIMDALHPGHDRLCFTCNPESALATRPAPGGGEAEVVVLPEGARDGGFAMTCSFTTMLLGALMVLDDTFDGAATAPVLAAGAEKLLAAIPERIGKVPDRVIFLGSGALTAIARESALKVLELTAGRALAQWDSPLGFRHGPKAAIDENTQIYVMLHPDPHTARYDLDLAGELARQFPRAPVLTIGPGGDVGFTPSGNAYADGVIHVLCGQILASHWSALLGLHVDDPFIDAGTLTRVVSHVKLYPFPPC